MSVTGFTMSVTGPSSSVSCLSGFSWANDAAGNSPCFVAAAVVGACISPDYNVSPLQSDSHYSSPGESGQPVDVCTCSWAAYNLYSACTACQGFNASILPWGGYNTNCTGSLVSDTTYYPSNVVTLDNTSIPFYATTNPVLWQNAIFNAGQAQNISEQGHPDVYGAPIPSSTPSKHKSNAGAIGGGVAGGVIFVLIGAVVVWWIMRKRPRRRNGKPQEIDSTSYNQGDTRSLSDLTPIGDSSFGKGGYTSSVSMQQPQMQEFAPSPFTSASNMASVSSMGAYYTPPSQPPLASTPSIYSADGNTISRYSSPSPSMQYMNRSQSPASNHMSINTTFGNDTSSTQAFLLPPPSTSPTPVPVAKTKTRADPYDGTTRNLQNSPVRLDPPSPQPRRVNPPAYDDVALSDSRDVAALRRESHGTGHVSRPLLGEKQPSQVSQTSQGSQDSSIWTTPASNAHGGPDFAPPEFAAIDSYVGQMAASNARPGGAGGADTVPMLHTTAQVSGNAGPSSSKRYTVNTTVDDGEVTSVLNGGEEDQGDPAIA